MTIKWTLLHVAEDIDWRRFCPRCSALVAFGTKGEEPPDEYTITANPPVEVKLFTVGKRLACLRCGWEEQCES